MKRIIAVALLGMALYSPSALAQMAKQKGVTLEALTKHVRVLSQKDDDVSKVELKQEAEAMAKSKDERFVSLAVRAYEAAGDTEKAEEVNESILKRFPKGMAARSHAADAIFRNEGANAEELEREYQKWIKQYPPKAFDEDNPTVYGFAAYYVGLRYAKEDNLEKMNEYLAMIEMPSIRIHMISDVAQELLKNKQHRPALPLLEKGYAQTQAAVKAEEADMDTKRVAQYDGRIAQQYGVALLADGQTDGAVEVLQKVHASRPSPETSLALAEGLAKQGQELDAFLLLQEYTVKNGKRADFSDLMSSLYAKLNGNKGDFENYLTSIEKQAKEALVAKYEAEMIKKEAPAFSLLNRKGETVSLADMKGKVVVLDFWATWCGPCKISFPGMQAAVNKYKDDPEVEFLFIDTWQSEKNYKELVDNFIKENHYTFHVLFDEMKDRAKATVTAYGVKGIPTKVVIDKEGFIRFQSSGGSDDVEKIVNEMETKIDLVKKG